MKFFGFRQGEHQIYCVKRLDAIGAAFHHCAATRDEVEVTRYNTRDDMTPNALAVALVNRTGWMKSCEWAARIRWNVKKHRPVVILPRNMKKDRR